MNSQAQWTALLSVVFLCGCQSLESLVPWQSTSTPRYTAEELAALDAPKFAAAETQKETPKRSAAPKTSSSGILQTSYTPDSPSTGVSADRLQQLVRSGQMIVASGQNTPAKLAEARHNFEQALALDTRHPGAHHGLAIVADLQQDYQTAEFHYKQALTANPSDPDLLNDLGYSYVLQNRFSEATNYLNRVLQVAPQHERAKVNMALMSLKRGNRQEAYQTLSGMYAPAKATQTLAKLEQSLSEMQATSVSPNTPRMQTAQTPPSNAAAQDVLRRMQQERQQTNSTAGVEQPIHVYPPGFESKPAANPVQNIAQTPHYNGGVPQQSRQNQQQVMGPGNAQMPLAIYPNQQVQAQVPNQQFANSATPQNQNTYQQPPQQYAPGSMQSMNMPAPQNPQSTQNQNPSQLANLQNQYPNQVPASSYGTNPAQMAQNVPLAGLNAGPGTLFPIGASNGPTVGNGALQRYGTGTNGTFQPQNQGSPQSQMISHPNGLPSPVSQNGYPPQNEYQYSNAQSNPNGSSPVSYSQIQNQQSFQNPHGSVQNTQQFQNPHPQYQQVQQVQPSQQIQPYIRMVPGNTQPANTAMNQMNQMQQQGKNALEAYERQLQNLDSQYNRAIQQMDGNGVGLSTVPAQY